jgi:hypothetical protein
VIVPSRVGDQHLPDPGDGRKGLPQDHVRILVKLVEWDGIGTNGVDQDWALSRIGLAVGGRGRGVLREIAAGSIDGLLHVRGSAIYVSAEIELQRHRCLPKSHYQELKQKLRFRRAGMAELQSRFAKRARITLFIKAPYRISDRCHRKPSYKSPNTNSALLN